MKSGRWIIDAVLIAGILFVGLRTIPQEDTARKEIDEETIKRLHHIEMKVFGYDTTVGPNEDPALQQAYPVSQGR